MPLNSGSGGGGDGGDGGGGGGGGWTPGPVPAGEERVFPNNTEVKWDKVFEDKVAVSSTYTYEGTEGEKWQKTTRGYWLSKCPGVQNILGWAEALEGKELKESDMVEALASGLFCDMDFTSMLQLSRAVWGFLNHCIKGKARDQFDAADTLNGLDAWRRLIHDIRKGRWVNKERLRLLVKNVKPITRLEDVPAAIMAYDKNIKAYELVVGKGKIDEDDKKSDLLNSLPTDIREQLQWRLSLPEQYEDFKNHLESTSHGMLFQRGKLPNLNLLDEGHSSAAPASPESDVFSEAVIAAVMKRWGKTAGGGGAGGGRQQSAPAAQRTGPTSFKCVNCGSDAHPSRDCPKPRIEDKSKRPCWKCGKLGHLGKDCRGGGQAAKLVDNADELPDFFGSVDFEDCRGPPAACIPCNDTFDKLLCGASCCKDEGPLERSREQRSLRRGRNRGTQVYQPSTYAYYPYA